MYSRRRRRDVAEIIPKACPAQHKETRQEQAAQAGSECGLRCRWMISHRCTNPAAAASQSNPANRLTWRRVRPKGSGVFFCGLQVGMFLWKWIPIKLRGRKRLPTLFSGRFRSSGWWQRAQAGISGTSMRKTMEELERWASLHHQVSNDSI